MSEDDATSWFEPLYAETAAAGGAPPWNRDAPRRLLTDRLPAGGAEGRACVVGCGLGTDAEAVAAAGYATTAFDISPTAIRLARERHPGTSVDYVVADLLDLPPDWRGAFDLVVEIWTIQALPDPPRGDAIAAIGDLVAPGGSLIVVALANLESDDDNDPKAGPPWPLTRETVESFGRPYGPDNGLERVVNLLGADPDSPERRAAWTLEFRRARR